MNKDFYIFLDIDWVLSIMNDNYDRHSESFDEECSKNFKKIQQSIKNLKIVISSTWRWDMDTVIKYFNNSWLDSSQIVWKTWYWNKWRWDEIQTYINENNIKYFVIIDDDSFDIKPIFNWENFIKTSTFIWLTFEESKKIVNYFRNINFWFKNI